METGPFLTAELKCYPPSPGLAENYTNMTFVLPIADSVLPSLPLFLIIVNPSPPSTLTCGKPCPIIRYKYLFEFIRKGLKDNILFFNISLV